MLENTSTNLASTFEVLLEEVEAEIEFTNKVGAKAFETRDYERAQEALARVAQITTFRDKMAGLRREWGELTGRAVAEEEEQGERRDLGHFARGLRPRVDSFRVPILQSIADLGGSNADGRGP